MGNGHDYVALEWVRGEIDETLNQARQALEAFADNRDDVAQIRFCLNYIHQVHGTLQMVEFYGAALLAEEMEKLADKLIHKRIERVTDAISVLMQAILKLPDYLEHLTAGRKDVPVLLLPILNDLRACRGETLLSDSSLFTPNLTPVRYTAADSARHRLQDPKMVEHLKKLRKMYRAALLGIKKNEKVEENLHYLHKVALRLEKLCQHTPHAEFWTVVAALMEMLATHELEASSAIKKLVIDVEHVLKDLYDDRHEALVLPVNEDVLKNVLFYIAKTDTNLAHATKVKQRFSLGQALSTQEEIDAERGREMGPGKDTISSVTNVISDELARIKDQLDLYVRSEYRDVSDLEDVLPGLHQISNTITILGLSTPRQVIEEQIATIQKHVDSGESPDDATIMDIAGALLYVEGTLAGLSEEKKRERTQQSKAVEEESAESRIAPGQIEAANEAVLREIRNGLEQAKNCIVSFSASGWDKSEINDAPAILSTVKGGLQIISLSQAAGLVDACNRFVQKALLASDQPPNMKQLETLADAITSIEYYLERLSAGSQDNDLILQVAEESVTALGFPVGAEETYQTLQPETPTEETIVEVSASEKERDDDLIDDEIIEIFIEEAQEVLESMDEYFPAYRDAPEDPRALAELRRAFHTLKGSGRLVGAATVGELAWAVENMLNRVIDSTITHNNQMFELLANVIRFLPGVIDAFKEQRDAPDISEFVSQAELIASNKQSQLETAETDSDLKAAQAIKDAEPDWEEHEEPGEAEVSEAVASEDMAAETEAGQDVEAVEPEEAPEPTTFEGGATLIYTPQTKAQLDAERDEPEEIPEEERAKSDDTELEAELDSEFATLAEEDVVETSDSEEALVDMAPEEEEEDELIDDEIIEIFIEEAEEVLGTIDEFLPTYLSEHDNREALTELRRAFHTLKGSGRMVGATVAGELAWSIENLLNKIIDGSIFMNDDIADLMQAVVGILPDLVEDFKLQRKPSHDTAVYESQASALAKGELVQPLRSVMAPAASAPGVEAVESAQEEAGAVEDSAPELPTISEDAGLLVDPVLLEIFESETRTHIATLREFGEQFEAAGEPISMTDDVSRALHTLKGSANTAGIEPIAKIVIPVEKFAKDARAVNVFADQSVIDIFEIFVSFIETGLNQLSTTPQKEIEGTEDFLKDLAAVQLEKLSDYDVDAESAVSEKPDPQLINIFLTTGIDILLDAERILEHWKHNPVPGEELEQLVGELQTLANGAEVAQLTHVEDLCRALELAYEHARDESFAKDDYFISTVIAGHEALLNRMDQVAAGLATHPDPELLDRLSALAPDYADVVPPVLSDAVSEESVLSEGLDALDEIPTLSEEEELAGVPEEEVLVDPGSYIALDPEMVEIFLEEANDLIDESGEQLQRLSENMQDKDVLGQLQRTLHTLKGGARMAEIAAIGDLSHELESLFERLGDGRLQPREELTGLLFACHDSLAGMVESIAANNSCEPANELVQQVARYIAGGGAAEVAPVEVPVARPEEDQVFTTEAGDSGAFTDTDYDPEMVEIFLEEAFDIINNTSDLLDNWHHNLGELSFIKELQRELHTLKGGARMAELSPIGDLAHEMENVFERLVDGRMDASEALVQLCLRCHDALSGMVDSIANQQPLTAATELEAQLAAALQGASFSVSEPEIEVPDESLTEDVAEEAMEASAPEEEGTSEDEATAEGEELAEHAQEDAIAGAEQVTLDPEMVEIFLEEAEDIIHNSGELLNNWESDLSDTGFVKELQRELHTLKGGARMAEISAIGDLAHEMENIFERITDGRMQASEAIVALSLKCHDELATMVEMVASTGSVKAAPHLIAELQAMLAGGASAAPEMVAVEDLEAPAMEAPVAEEEIEEPVSEEAFEALDPEMAEIFLEEAQELIDSTANSLQDWTDDFDNLDISKALQRDMHTLKGGARMSGIQAIGDLAHELETLFESIVEGKIRPTDNIKDLMLECHDALAGMVEDVTANKLPQPAKSLIDAILEVANEGATESVVAETIKLERAGEDKMESLVTDPDHDNIVEMFIDESEEQIGHIRDRVDAWKSNPDDLQSVIEIQRALDALKGSAKLADIDPVDNLASAMAKAAEQTMEGNASVTEELLTLSEQGVAMLSEMLAKLSNGQPVPRATDLIQALSTLSLSEERDVATAEVSGSEEDAEVIEIFLEEANDLLETIDNQMDGWSKDPSNQAFNKELQRALHTLKGGARLSGLKSLGDASHAFESMLIQSEDDTPVFDGDFREQAQKHFDGLNELVETVRESHREMVERGPVATPQAPAAAEDKAAPVAKSAAQTEETQIIGRQMAPDQATKPPQAAQPAARQAQQETVRVGAGLLDELVNLAGETSITRGRLETQISDFSHTLEEMTATIERLKEQLRRMDIETEAQVLFRVEREGTGTGADYSDDFDPLEMDRYSSIQQLSRALTESASDLMDLKDELAEKSRDAETLLLQQSRINTELQEGLMKTRMIPFSSMVPRLRRIVRQVSGELKKKVEFDVHNAEGEMDRTVLERMVAPLEHMLRNALDHGIEDRERRLASGKSESGTIDLSLSREGGDIVLRMKDDGGGIPVEVIRKKAIERGLLDESTQISNHEVLQFIMQAGFSTAQKVTQISGRGVGMDVVASEIKQLGGQITIDSEVGRGTEFTIRLPFTVSVNRALMVNTGEDFYAIPLNTIEGIVRVSSYELEEYYKPDAPLYEYAGKKYKLQYIGSLLQSEHKPKLQGQPLPLPVILVRGGEQSMALQVDSLMGSREIVVKSMGAQFSSVRGVSGATILGDGSVVVILDLPALIRADMNVLQQKGKVEEKVAPISFRPTQVMVVDDSVTVRKVTTRLLQRNGMEVITAKDGVDAVSILQEVKPDIMLLDIEMPRMDGFEVASFVRHDEHLQDVPIVMITSRTGQKHKDRAMSIGVNEYLGKPFQEKTLLSTIEKLVKK